MFYLTKPQFHRKNFVFTLRHVLSVSILATYVVFQRKRESHNTASSSWVLVEPQENCMNQQASVCLRYFSQHLNLLVAFSVHHAIRSNFTDILALNLLIPQLASSVEFVPTPPHSHKCFLNTFHIPEWATSTRKTAVSKADDVGVGRMEVKACLPQSKHNWCSCAVWRYRIV